MASILQDQNRWAVTGNISMHDVNALLEQSKQLTIADGTSIDFKQVGEVDTAAVSLMLEWKRRAAVEQRALTFTNLPDSLASLLGLYEIEALFN